MIAKRDAPIRRNLFHHAAQLAHPGHEFQGELPVMDGGRDSLVLRPNRIFQYHFWKRRSHRRLDEMGSRAVGRNAPDYRSALPGILFRERREHSGVGADWETGFRPGLADRQPVRSFHQTIRAR